MILSILKFVALIITALVLGVIWLIKFVLTLFGDATIQAKDATPGIVDEVKSHVTTEASALPAKFANIEDNVRRLVRVPKRRKPEAPREILQLTA